MIMRKKQNKNKRGAVLVLAVVIVVILAIIGVALLRLGFYSRLQAIRTTQKISARTAADAGIEHAVLSIISWWDNLAVKTRDAINTSPLLNVPISHTFTDAGGTPDTYGSAGFAYDIRKIPPDPDPDYDEYAVALVESVGTAVNMTKTVGVKIWFLSEFKAIGVEHGIIIRNDGMLYVIPLNETFDIQTNSIISPAGAGLEGIELKNGVYVPGEVVIGPGGDTEVAVIDKKDVVIEDGAQVAPDLMKFTTPVPPPLSAGTYFYSNPDDPNHIIRTSATKEPNDVRTITDNGTFSDLVLDPGEKIIIHGHHGIDPISDDPIPLEVHIEGKVLLKSDTEILITRGSAIDLYLGGNVSVMTGSAILYEDAKVKSDDHGEVPEASWVLDGYEDFIIEAAKSLTIYGTATCTVIDFSNGSDLYALISAPFADIRMKNSGDFYGAVIASNSFMLDNSGNFYFVAALFDFPPEEILTMGIKPGSWWEE